MTSHEMKRSGNFASHNHLISGASERSLFILKVFTGLMRTFLQETSASRKGTDCIQDTFLGAMIRVE